MKSPNSNGPASVCAARMASSGRALRIDLVWVEQVNAARMIELDAAERIKREQQQSKRLDWLSTVLGVIATLLAASAAITAVPGNVAPWITAVCAFASALISGLMTRFHPADVAQHLRAASIRWLRVMDEARYVQRAFEANAGSVSFDDAEKQLRSLEMLRDDALGATPSAGTQAPRRA